MYVTTVIFVIMCFFYKYVEPRDDASSQADNTSMSTAEDGLDKKGGKANSAFSLGDPDEPGLPGHEAFVASQENAKAHEGLREEYKEEGKQKSKEAWADESKEQNNAEKEEDNNPYDNHAF